MTVIGISVGPTGLRSVLVRGSRVVWSAHVVLLANESLADGVARLLATCPSRPISKPRVVVSLGTAHCQVKDIAGLPVTENIRMLTRIVRENTASFFLCDGTRLVVSDVIRHSNGATLASAFDAVVGDQILNALRRRQLSRVTIVPTLIATATFLGEGTYSVGDDETIVELTVGPSGAVRRVRRTAGVVPTPLSTPMALAAIGLEYFDAYAATQMSRAVDFTWRPAPDPRRTRVIERVRVATTSVVFIGAAIAATIAPGLRAQRTAARAEVELTSGRTAAVEAARVEAELMRVSKQLDRMDRFSAARGRMSLLLGAIAQAIPESTAIVTLRVDSLEGSFVALTPHAADVLPNLSAIDGMIGARIVGSVTRENQGTVRLERATIRFRRQRELVRTPQLSATKQRSR